MALTPLKPRTKSMTAEVEVPSLSDVSPAFRSIADKILALELEQSELHEERVQLIPHRPQVGSAGVALGESEAQRERRTRLADILGESVPAPSAPPRNAAQDRSAAIEQRLQDIKDALAILRDRRSVERIK